MLIDEAWNTERVQRDVVPREDWGAGPWDGEPDLVLWRVHGVPCLIVRHYHYGSLCGYLGVPRWSSCFRVPYQEIDHLFPSAHGGLTHSGPCLVPFAGSRDFWWIGFDCGHSFDIAPSIWARCPELRSLPPIEFGDGWTIGSGYRPLGYVRRRLEEMVQALLRLPRRRYRRRRDAKRVARIAWVARKELVRLAGSRTPGAAFIASNIHSRLHHSLGVNVSVPRSLRRTNAFFS